MASCQAPATLNHHRDGARTEKKVVKCAAPARRGACSSGESDRGCRALTQLDARLIFVGERYRPSESHGFMDRGFPRPESSTCRGNFSSLPLLQCTVDAAAPSPNNHLKCLSRMSTKLGVNKVLVRYMNMLMRQSKDLLWL